MELWRKVWRHGITPYLSHAALLALRDGLLRDDPRLVQGIAVSPPCVDVFHNLSVQAACAVGYGPWQCGEAVTVHTLHLHGANVITLAELALGEAGCVRYFLNWFDETPRDVMRRELLSEIGITLATKAVA